VFWASGSMFSFKVEVRFEEAIPNCCRTIAIDDDNMVVIGGYSVKKT